MSNDEQLNIIDSYLDRGDCRSAEGAWDALNREHKEGNTTYSRAILEAKWVQIRQKSEELVPLIEKEIENFLTNDSIDEKFAEGLLYRLERALLRETSFKHSTISNRVNGKIFQNRENAIYAEAEKTVKFHWDSAIALQTTTPTISPKVLLPYYTQALQEAKQLLSQYEKNEHYTEPFKDRLRQLVEDAEKRRESLNVAEKSLTSGALIEDYVTTLEYIRNNPVDIKVQIFDELGGSIIDVAPKEDAYKIYSDRALVLARKKLTTYMEGGEGRLGIRQLLALGRPREAEAIHVEYTEKFGRLEREFVPEITRLEERQDFFRFKAEIDSQLYLFEEIEDEAQRIAKQAANVTTRPELMSLWTEYLGNLRRYPLAEQSSTAVKDAYQALRRRFLAYLFTVADSIDVAIQSGEFARAESIIKENNAVLALPIVAGEDVVNRIRAYDEELDKIAAQMADIGTRINDMFARMMTDSATNLMNSLRDLRNTYDETLLKSHADYQSVVEQVTSRDSAVGDVERLRGYLTSPNMLTVESQVKYAREKSRTNPLYEPITNELDAYLEFMKSGDLPLNERVVKLRQLATSSMVSDENLKGRIAKSLAEAEKQEQVALSNERSFTRATNALKSNEFIEAWQSLDLIKSPGNKAEEGKWNDLFVESIMRYPINKSFDVNLLTRLGEMHRKLPDSFVPPRYQVLYEVQTARALKTSDEMISAYESILTRVSGTDADAITELLNEVKTAQFVTASSDLLNQRPNTANPKDTEFENWLNDLREFVKKGIDLAREQPTQAVHYYVTCLKLDLLYIQNTPVISNRNSAATRVEDTVPKINAIISQSRKNPLNSADQQVVEVAGKIRAIVGIIDDMVKYVTDGEANIQRFKTTLDTLNNFFGEGMPARDVLRDFTSEYDAYLKTISNALRDKSQNATGNDRYSPKAFLRYAKMLLVNPDSKRDIDNFIQLENLKRNFSDQLKTTFETFMTDDKTPLNEMVMRLDEQLKDMQSLSNIAENLTGVTEFSEFAGEIRTIIPLVEKMRNAIQNFDARTKKFSMRLEGYPLTYDTLDTYSMKLTEELAQFQEDVNGYFADLIMNTLGIQVGDVGKSHPVVLGFEDKKHTLSKDFATIVSHWTTILNLTNAQDFARALTEMDNFEALKHQFEIFKTKRVYGDKLPTMLQTEDMQIALPSVNGYAGVREWLLSGQKTIELLRVWRNAQTSDGIAVGEFDKMVASADEYRQHADFNNALQTLGSLISTESRLVKYENIPYLANSQGRQKIATSFDYAGAIRDCPYLEAKKIIEQAQKEYHTLVNEIAKIRGIRDSYVLAASQHERLEDEFNKAYNQIKRAGRKDKEILRAQAQMILVQMEQISPRYLGLGGLRKKLAEA